ncbi:type II toxin-antitoxin system VapC family toxin [Paracidobacterium acidisoli]|uniref:PIN domain-containing protein n=1 Tax=Paracidobacterium acidisoli TaxID=2303751 RepID=A0A372IQG3_9BACT|nr:type II toxin-antitoxin system VapC family toxin [Paracidobacterium acidisoli]MBT9331090.1 type II toxin-antitoxin system VapC family toxin [Paracidobacterium acidisoli]
MSKIVLDASAILAVIAQEPGADLILAHIGSTVASTVNLAEAQSKLVHDGAPKDDAWEDILTVVQEVISFDAEQAKLAGALRTQTRSLGLSLGDRACLALAISIGAPVYTADRIWKKLRLGIPIHVIR